MLEFQVRFFLLLIPSHRTGNGADQTYFSLRKTNPIQYSNEKESLMWRERGGKGKGIIYNVVWEAAAGWFVVIWGWLGGG